MSITTSSGDGVRCTTAAKDSWGAASTLGSQAAAAADEVIVPDAISANNEGNLESTPTYVGRIIVIRPWVVYVTALQSDNEGSGYAVDDVLTIGGSSAAAPAGLPQITVTSVDGGGAITGFDITRKEGFEWRASGMTGGPSPPTATTTSTGGTGTGATFRVVAVEPGFEIRYITADASNTLTVHEPWVDPPASGDNWAIAYILEDCATVTGCTLRAQSGVFEFSRAFSVGNASPSGTQLGFFAQTDGKQFETDNVTSATGLGVDDDGVYQSGYLIGGHPNGLPTAGGYISTSGTLTAGTPFRFKDHSLVFAYDLQMRAPRDAPNMVNVGFLTSTGGEIQSTFAIGLGGAMLRNKWLDIDSPSTTSQMATQGRLFRDTVLERSANSGRPGSLYEALYEVSTDRTPYGPYTWIQDLIIKSEDLTASPDQGIRVRDFSDTFQYPAGLRDITFIGNTRYMSLDTAGTDQKVSICNPVWTLDLSNQDNLQFNDSTSRQIEEMVSLSVVCVDAENNQLAGIHGYVFEGAQADDLYKGDTAVSDSATIPAAPGEGGTGRIPTGTSHNYYGNDFRFMELWGEIAYASYVRTNLYTWDGIGAGSGVADQQGEFFAWSGYSYGSQPVRISFEPVLDGGLRLSSAFVDDPDLTALTQSAALTNPTTNPTVTKHGPGETDTRPMKALNYDGGTGGTPTLGVTATQGLASGTIVDYEGNAVSGVILLDGWNGVEFAENQTITDTGTFSATTNLEGGTGFYAEYTWEIDAKGEALTVVYDYISARMAESPITAEFEQLIVWGGDEFDARLPLSLGSDGWFTPRAVRRWNGQVLSGATRDFTDDFNRTDENLSVSANWDDVDNATNGMRVVSNALAGDNSAGTTNVGAVATTAHNPTAAQYVEATLSALPTAGDRLGIALRIDTTSEQCYAAIVAEGTPDTYEIVHVDFSTSAGVITTLATGASTPSATDVLQFVAIGQTLIMFVNGTEEARFVDGVNRSNIASGRVGVFAEGDAAPAGRLDGFGSGDLLNSVINGEGVWIHDRGTGIIDYLTADDGSQFSPVQTITIVVNGVSQGTAVVVESRDTVGGITAGDILFEGFATSAGLISFTLIYPGADFDINFRCNNPGHAVAAIADDGGVFTDETEQSTDDTLDDMNILPAAPALNDAYYFGHTEQFPALKFWVTDGNGTGSTITWEYWDGLAWSALTVGRDDTSDFENTGHGQIVEWTVPGDWATTTVTNQANGGQLYYVRARLSTVGSANQTRARSVRVDATRYLAFPQSGNAVRTVTDTGLTATAVWLEDTIGKFEVT